MFSVEGPVEGWLITGIFYAPLRVTVRAVYTLDPTLFPRKHMCLEGRAETFADALANLATAIRAEDERALGTPPKGSS